MKLREKLLMIQSELKAPKSQVNSFGHYNYRNCEDILEALKPLLVKYKACLTLRDKITKIGDRYYVKASVTISNAEDISRDNKPLSALSDFTSEEMIESFAYAREELDKKGMDGSQITGASSSYARKYALNGLFLIDDTKDSDTTNSGYTKINSPTPPQQTNVIKPSNSDPCPKCGSPLVAITNNPKMTARCSTNKWDPTTKTASGCDYVKWASKPSYTPEKLPDKVVDIDFGAIEEMPF